MACLHRGSFTVTANVMQVLFYLLHSCLCLHISSNTGHSNGNLHQGLCAFVLQLTVKFVMLCLESNCQVLNVKYNNTALTALGNTTSSPYRKLSHKGQQELKHVACLYTKFLHVCSFHYM